MQNKAQTAVQTAVREQTQGEEWANSLSHGLGLLGLLVAAVIAWPSTSEGDREAGTVGVGVYLASMVLLYGVSALYHGLPPGRAKTVMMKLDYCAIYVFIAGTYTPFALGVLAGHGGTILLYVIWTLAVLGVVLQATGRLAHPLLSTGLYIGMGWSVLAVAKPLMALLPTAGLIWLLAGGLCYTGGVLFFLLDSKLKFAHSIWHLFVLAGSVCHFIAVGWYA
jgi:hemolysin III